MRKPKEYALYRGEQFIQAGTKTELADLLGVTEKTIMFYTTACYMKRAEAGNIEDRLVVVKIEDDEDDLTEEEIERTLQLKAAQRKRQKLATH